MISKQSAPIGWSMLMYELEDAKEHLANLILAMDTNAEYDEANLRIDLGHIFSHLNRAWHRRDVPENLTEDQWKNASQFPVDLPPI
jgi:hypothetical protein